MRHPDWTRAKNPRRVFSTSRDETILVLSFSNAHKLTASINSIPLREFLAAPMLSLNHSYGLFRSARLRITRNTISTISPEKKGSFCATVLDATTYTGVPRSPKNARRPRTACSTVYHLQNTARRGRGASSISSQSWGGAGLLSTPCEIFLAGPGQSYRRNARSTRNKMAADYRLRTNRLQLADYYVGG